MKSCLASGTLTFFFLIGSFGEKIVIRLNNYTNTRHSLGLSNDIKSYPCHCVKSKGFVLPVFDEIEIDELRCSQEPCYTGFVVFELNMEQATY